MMSRDSKKLQVFVQRAHGVSRALWPANARRCVPTGKVAQKRRSLIIHWKWWTTLANISHVGLIFVLIISSMLLGGMLVAAMVLHRWYLLLMPSFVLMTVSTSMTVVIARSFKLQRAFLPKWQPGMSLPSIFTMRRTPQTPMPSTPLVRVLETLDLSQSNVEHFLDTSGKRNTAELALNLEKEQSAQHSQRSVIS